MRTTGRAARRIPTNYVMPLDAGPGAVREWRPQGEASMSTRTKAPLGSPCWVDLWTSDVEGSRSVLQRTLLLGGARTEPGIRGLLHVHARGRSHRGWIRRHGRHESQQHLEDLSRHARHRCDRARDRRTAVGRSMLRSWRWRTWARNSSSAIPVGRISAPGNPARFLVSPCSTNRVHQAGSSCTRATSRVR